MCPKKNQDASKRRNVDAEWHLQIGKTNQEENNMAKFLEFSIRIICKYLLIDTCILISSEIEKNNTLHRQDRVIEICKRLEADEYINAIGGQSLYNFEDFAAQRIMLKFLKTGEIKYKQFGDSFVPNLSIIDVMMFNSVEEIHKMLENYNLI